MTFQQAMHLLYFNRVEVRRRSWKKQQFWALDAQNKLVHGQPHIAGVVTVFHVVYPTDEDRTATDWEACPDERL